MPEVEGDAQELELVGAWWLEEGSPKATEKEALVEYTKVTLQIWRTKTFNKWREVVAKTWREGRYSAS